MSGVGNLRQAEKEGEEQVDVRAEASRPWLVGQIRAGGRGEDEDLDDVDVEGEFAAVEVHAEAAQSVAAVAVAVAAVAVLALLALPVIHGQLAARLEISQPPNTIAS